jgi:CO/xanthine dehydrogenase Mo-binding subunit
MSRREDHRLTTGQGRYASDWNLPCHLDMPFTPSKLWEAIRHARSRCKTG